MEPNVDFEEPEDQSEDEEWFTEVCIALRGPKSEVEKAYSKLIDYSKKIKGITTSCHCDSSGPETEYP
jgi:uncharacterized protein YifE (UPF0438 family)